jgi:Heme exporter protein D (CcmD)
MNQWAFVWAAYAVTLAGTLGVTLWAWAEMRKAEKAAQR